MIVEQLKEQEGFSSIECSIANYFLEAGEALREQSARSIATKLYTAPSTVSRFCKRLGYEGYSDFRDDYLDELRYLSSSFTGIDANQPFRKSDDTRTIAAKMGALWRETVDDTLQLVDGEALEHAVRLVARARNVFVYSAGPQSYLAEDFVDKMARIGHRVIVTYKDDTSYFFSANAQPDEVFVVLSYSGETSGALRIAERAKAAGSPVIALTSFGRNSLSRMADVVLHVSTREKLVEKLGCFGMSISTMLLLDVLYSCVLAADYDRNVVRRVAATRAYEVYRDSDNPILHDRRNASSSGDAAGQTRA